MGRLSEPDKTYIFQWQFANKSKIDYNFILDWSDKSVAQKRSQKRNSTLPPGVAFGEQVDFDPRICQIKITNRSSQAVQFLEVRYQIQYLKMEGRAKTMEQSSGRQVIPMIQPTETLTLDSKIITLRKSVMSPGSFYTDPKIPRKQQDEIKGVVVSLWHQGKQVHEFISRGIQKIP